MGANQLCFIALGFFFGCPHLSGVTSEVRLLPNVGLSVRLGESSSVSARANSFCSFVGATLLSEFSLIVMNNWHICTQPPSSTCNRSQHRDWLHRIYLLAIKMREIKLSRLFCQGLCGNRSIKPYCDSYWNSVKQGKCFLLALLCWHFTFCVVLCVDFVQLWLERRFKPFQCLYLGPRLQNRLVINLEPKGNLSRKQCVCSYL